MADMTAGIYAIINRETGSCYVGSAVNIGRRWNAHRHSLRNHRKAPPRLQNAWDKHGESVFGFGVLEICDESELIAREQFYIDVLKPKYNTRREAKSNLGLRWSIEANMKKGRPQNQYTVRGFTGSLRQVAKHFGVVTHECARWRMRRGWAVEEAFLTPAMEHAARGARGAEVRNNSTRGRHETAFGVTANLTDLHRQFGVTSEFAFKRRIGLGWDLGEALTRPARGAPK
jgi:hypothetical protein